MGRGFCARRTGEHLEPDRDNSLDAALDSFAGEGFAGFAWSTVNPELVVAAVSQAYEGTLVDAASPRASFEGLYYSADSGATWTLATITDDSGRGRAGAERHFCDSGWQCGDFGGVESGAAAVCGGGALPRLLPVLGRHHLDADGGAARLGADDRILSYQFRQHRFTGCPIFAGRWR